LGIPLERAKLQLIELRLCIQARVKRLLLLPICAFLTFALSSDSSHRRVQVEIRNVIYHFTLTIAVHITYIEGELEPTGPQSIPVFDDANSFTILIRSAKISVSTDALGNALNQYVLSVPDAPIKEVRITAQSNKLKIKGRLQSKGDVPFETEGSLSVTPDGRIRVHTEKIKAGRLPVKGLMDLLGTNLSKLIDTRKVQGLAVEKDDLLLTPSELFPAPHIQGSLRSISIVEDEVVQEYGVESIASRKLPGNYMAYHGAQLRFGKLTMNDADLTLIDMDPSDPFDFYLDHYREQLIAGYTKITPTFGLRSYFRDYNKLTPQQKTGASR
jgi:hypothetical protein